jgi:hypothetical protein
MMAVQEEPSVTFETIGALSAKIGTLLAALEETPCLCLYARDGGNKGPLLRRCVRCRTMLENGRLP